MLHTTVVALPPPDISTAQLVTLEDANCDQRRGQISATLGVPTVRLIGAPRRAYQGWMVTHGIVGTRKTNISTCASSIERGLLLQVAREW